VGTLVRTNTHDSSSPAPDAMLAKGGVQVHGRVRSGLMEFWKRSELKLAGHSVRNDRHPSLLLVMGRQVRERQKLNRRASFV